MWELYLEYIVVQKSLALVSTLLGGPVQLEITVSVGRVIASVQRSYL